MEYYKPILTLFTSLVIFHILFVWIFPQSKIFWKKIDYLWISLGVIGIIGSTFSLRSEYSKARNNLYEHYLAIDYNGLIESVNWNKKYFSSDGTGFNYDEFEDKTQAERFKNAELYYQSFSTLTQNLRDTIVKEKTLEYLDTLTLNFEEFKTNINNDYVVQTSESVEYYLKELNSSKNQYIENKDLGSKSSLNWTILFISPYLFAIAIAIRLTKVTAEIKELK